MDQFYALVTGEQDAFYQMCMALPPVIEKVVNEMEDVEMPHDTVMDELREWSQHLDEAPEGFSMAMAVYMLGFHGYYGFD